HLGAPGAAAHEGHDHAPPAPVAAAAQPRLVAASDAHELVAIAAGDALVLYLDRLDTNEPVTGATVEIEGPDGAVVATPKGDVYEAPAPWLARPGPHELIVTVTTAAGADILLGAIAGRPQAQAQAPGEPPAGLLARLRSDGAGWIGGAGFGFLAGAAAAAAAIGGRRRIAVAAALAALAAAALFAPRALAHEGHDHGTPAVAATPGGSLPHRDADGAVFAPKPMQRLLEIRTMRAREERHARAVELAGRVIADPNASGYAQASLSGRLSPPEGGFPRLGARVRQGDVLAYVAAPLTAAEQSDQRQRQSELDQQIAIVEQRIARYERLSATGAVARVQLDEARLELQGLTDRRASLDRMRRQPEALLAPVSGVVAAANAVAGQIAETNAIIFHIVDPSRLWIEALSFERLGTITGASARTTDGAALPLAFEGSGLADRSQAAPAHFSIRGPTAGLRIGQLVTVLAQTDDATTGVVLPRAAVVRGADGQALVYEHTAPERFAPRPVRVEPLDAARVLVAAGVTAGGRIVTRGAELLNQVR
ncbi:MAG TPA: efflux RND transporter periplasmic adaptor subunit, partial [Beijerinckiaceae bacterium]